MNCKRCSRPLRMKGESVDDHPGTVLHSARGLCKVCCLQAGKDGTLESYPPLPTLHTWTPRNCPDCDRPLRPYKALQADWPGTVGMYGAGRCRKDFEALGRNGHARQPHERTSVEANKASLNAWLARRPTK